MPNYGLVPPSGEGSSLKSLCQEGNCLYRPSFPESIFSATPSFRHWGFFSETRNFRQRTDDSLKPRPPQPPMRHTPYRGGRLMVNPVAYEAPTFIDAGLSESMVDICSVVRTLPKAKLII